MPNKLAHPLRNTAVHVLEDWALTLVDEANELQELFDPTKAVYMSNVNVHGILAGTVSIIAQHEFIETLATNLLGISSDDVPSEEECRDAFKEMGNVLAGNFLTEAYGEDVVFDLLHPEVREIPFSEVEDFVKREVVYGFLADDSPVAVTFGVKEG